LSIGKAEYGPDATYPGSRLTRHSGEGQNPGISRVMKVGYRNKSGFLPSQE
jgi:hypothetical protein